MVQRCEVVTHVPGTRPGEVAVAVKTKVPVEDSDHATSSALLADTSVTDVGDAGAAAGRTTEEDDIWAGTTRIRAAEAARTPILRTPKS